MYITHLKTKIKSIKKNQMNRYFIRTTMVNLKLIFGQLKRHTDYRNI